MPTAAYGGFSLASLAFAEAKLDGAISLYIVCKLDNFMDGEFAIPRPRPLSLPRSRGEGWGEGHFCTEPLSWEIRQTLI